MRIDHTKEVRPLWVATQCERARKRRKNNDLQHKFRQSRALGLDGDKYDPDIPDEIGRIQFIGTNAFGGRWNVEATAAQSYVRLAADVT